MRNNEYHRNHHRVRRKYGSAGDYQCELCESVAEDWSHTHGTDPTDPDNYRAFCHPCHTAYDHNVNSAARLAFWDDPEQRARQSEQTLALWDDPEYRAVHSAKAREQWRDPELRARLMSGMPQQERAALGGAKNAEKARLARAPILAIKLVMPTPRMTRASRRKHLRYRHPDIPRPMSKMSHARDHRLHQDRLDHTHDG